MPPLIITAANEAQQRYLQRERLKGRLLYGTAGCHARRSLFGSLSYAPPAVTRFPRIPRDKWPALIAAGKGTWLSDLRGDQLPPHDQDGTNYCWAHGSVRSVETLRLYEGQPPILLSPESVAVPLTNGRNRGGSPDEALEQLHTYGACDQSLWTPNTLHEPRGDATWKTERANHIVLNWLDVETFDDQMTLALHRIPIAIGLRWWGHLVCQLDPVQLDDGSFGIGIDNSWGPDWGENGYGILDERHGTADLGAFAPISETFSPT